MSSPNRPALRRQDSKVRFSRGDMSPVGTMASDSTVHGVHHHYHHDDPQDEQELYDANSYPFTNETSRSEDNGGFYRGVSEDEMTLDPHDSQSQRYGDYDEPVRAPDVYTSTPPRVGTRRWTNSQQQRPPLDTLLSEEAVEQVNNSSNMIISPRGSTIVGNYDSPSGPPPQNRSPYQHSPQTRPSSALRASLVIPSNGPGSPQRVKPQEAVIERLDYPRGSPARLSMPNIGATPPRRIAEQHRSSAPNGSPIIGSPQFGSPSPRQPVRQSPTPDAYNRPQGYRRYDDYDRPTDRLSPVPPYQSPRNSGAFQGDGWDREHRYAQGRHDSDSTLRNDLFEKRKYGPGEYEEKAKSSPRPDQDYRRSRSMSDETRGGDMRRRTTREMEGDTESYHVKGGVFSQLLRLTGRSATLRRRVSSQRSAAPGDLPTMKSLGLRRVDSAVSTAFGADELDPDDPRVTGQKKTRRRSSFSELPFMRSLSTDGDVTGKKKRRASIQLHVASKLFHLHKSCLSLTRVRYPYPAAIHPQVSQSTHDLWCSIPSYRVSTRCDRFSTGD